MLQGRNMTSFGSISTDLKNAGVQWEDKEVVVDNGLIISSQSERPEAFNKKSDRRNSRGRTYACALNVSWLFLARPIFCMGLVFIGTFKLQEST